MFEMSFVYTQIRSSNDLTSNPECLRSFIVACLLQSNGFTFKSTCRLQLANTPMRINCANDFNDGLTVTANEVKKSVFPPYFFHFEPKISLLDIICLHGSDSSTGSPKLTQCKPNVASKSQHILLQVFLFKTRYFN